MIDYGYKELNTNPAWLQLLSAYQEADQSSREDTEFDGWTPRINSLIGIDEAELCRVHGKLISLGYLKFELGNRLDGIKYQLSSDAVRALRSSDEEDEIEPEFDYDEEQLPAA
ncbi:MAG TPA: hypothetical protein VLA12_16525 [Planctomycetaceae bacterium]|nr:hypothetical protein [Planctomycetaceae bacterium]